MNCLQLTLRKCKIASDLAEAEVFPEKDACDYCSIKADPRQSINLVTVSLASAKLGVLGEVEKRKLLHTKFRHFLEDEVAGAKARASVQSRLKEVLNGTGVGSQLWRLLTSLGILHKPDCGCLVWAEKMNLWGADGCEENFDRIIKSLKDNSSSYGWSSYLKAGLLSLRSGLFLHINPLDPVPGLVRVSIDLVKHEASR